MKLFTCSWVPTNCEPKALIFLCHGYAMECSTSMKDAGIRLAKSGFSVYGIGYEGHGKSEGLQGYVHNFDAVVDDYDMRPHPMVTSVVTKLCNFIPTWKIVPTQDVTESAFRDTEVRKEIRNNPYCYKGKPRLQTAHQLITASMHLEQRLEEVTLPFLIFHGGEDTVTDPSISKLLYEKASSLDKSFKLYPILWQTPGEQTRCVLGHRRVAQREIMHE
ncbi:hypothetical protein HAX54_019114 [Datura stramonium]|uniref:Serine aminopeptidase S33 domain-containing protein n=1 Tax=Datura stramonium TaxID=4076 RepID=A0ABS8UQI2_DATST|nr:hypothetical protein [Datura stramonium]